MIMQDLGLPVFIIGLVLLICFSIEAVIACGMLERIPDNANEKTTRNSWTRPARTSYISILVAWIIFTIASCMILVGNRIMIAIGIGLAVFSALILLTASILAFAGASRKMHPNANIKITLT
jgi:uncharacterized membrane protein